MDMRAFKLALGLVRILFVVMISVVMTWKIVVSYPVKMGKIWWYRKYYNFSEVYMYLLKKDLREIRTIWSSLPQQLYNKIQEDN